MEQTKKKNQDNMDMDSQEWLDNNISISFPKKKESGPSIPRTHKLPNHVMPGQLITSETGYLRYYKSFSRPFETF